MVLSGVMSASMTYIASSFYVEPNMNKLASIWVQAWMTAFIVIFLLLPVLHHLSRYLTAFIQK